MKDGLKALPEPVQLLPVLVLLAALVLFLFAGCGTSSGDIQVPITVKDADNVGSLHAELVFDPAVLEAVGVAPGELSKNAMIEHNLQTPGRVIIGIVDSSGINGAGSLVKVSFEVIDKDRNSQLILENIQAHNVDSLMDVITETSNGNFSAEDKEVTAPVITLRP